MSKLYGEILAKDLLTLDKSFARANGQPLDASEVYYSLEAAQAYAATAQAYVGQKIVVIEDGIVTHYSVENTNGDLKELGSKPIADEATITIDENGSISLFGTNALEDTKLNDEGEEVSISYQPVFKDGKLSWRELSSTSIEDVGDQLQGLEKEIDELKEDFDNLQIPTDVNELTNSAGYQTENQVSAAIAAAISDINHAVFEKVDEVPFASLADTNILYLVPNGEHHDIYVRIGDEMVKIDDTDADLSQYLTAEDLEGLVDEKTLEDYVLKSVLDTLVSKENFGAILNENKTIIDLIAAADKAHEHSNKSILDLITQDLIDKWNSGEANVINDISEEFTLQDKSLAIKLISADKISGLDKKIENSVNEKLKDFNGTILDSISINNTQLAIDENKNIDLPIASNTTLGLIYAIGVNNKDNKVSIEEDGTLSVKTVNVNTLTQNKNEFLVLNGGNAALTDED